METVRELRLALRTLAKSPGFSMAVLGILGLGLGAAISVVDLTNLLAWRMIPAERPHELVKVYTERLRGFSGPWGMTSYPDYLDYRDAVTSFSVLAAFREEHVEIDTGTAGNGERLPDGRVAAVSGNYFEVLGLGASRGRLLGPEDDRPGAEPVVVLSHAMWARLGADPAAVGSTIRIQGESFTVVGVGPEILRSTVAGMRLDAFLPAHALGKIVSPKMLEDRDFTRFDLLGRLAPGVTPESARAELTALAKRLDADHPRTNRDPRQIHTGPARLAHPIDLDRMAPSLRLFAIAVGLLLIITCANIAHLLLARAATRRGEMAVRLSLGAGRGTLMRQLFWENLLLGLGGGVLGLVVAVWMRGFLTALIGPEFTAEMRFDLPVLGASLGLCLAATVLFGWAPALAASRVDLRAWLGHRSVGRPRRSAGPWLAGAQVALAFVLLVAGALLGASLWNRLHGDRGFEDRNLLIAALSLSEQEYTAEESRVFFETLRRRAEALPGVERVGTAMIVPPTLFDISLPFRLPGESRQDRTSRINYVDTDFFEALEIPLLRGRGFSSTDGQDGTPVVMVNRKAAETLWPGQDAVGRRIEIDSSLPGDAGPEHTVIGVVGNVDQYRASTGGEPVLYFSWNQRPRFRRQLVMRAPGDAEAIFAGLREIVDEMDAGVAPLDTRTGRENRRFAFTFEHLQATTVGLFAGAGFLLALVGLFAVLGYDVARRGREIGIRMAVGAARSHVVGAIIVQGLRVAVAGTAVGLLAVLVAGLFAPRAVADLLYGIGVADLRVLSAVALVVLAASAGAAYGPARRASRLDPAEVLRRD